MLLKMSREPIFIIFSALGSKGQTFPFFFIKQDINSHLRDLSNEKIAYMHGTCTIVYQNSVKDR